MTEQWKSLINLEETERVSCNICKSDDSEVIGARSRFGIPLTTVICRRCALIYINPRLTKEANDRFYEEAYRKLLRQEERPLEDFLDEQRFLAKVRILSFCADHIRQGGKILDIGCSTGGVLSAIREAKGCELFGVEPSLAHSEFATRRCGVNVQTDVFENVVYADNTFDFVILTQVLNHLLDPLESLRKVRQILRPDGAVYLEVFNFVERIRNFPYEDSITIDHPYMFCEESIRCILQRSGFQVASIVTDHMNPGQRPKEWTARHMPWYHTRVVAKPGPVSDQYADYREVKNRIQASRREYSRKQLMKPATYKYYAGRAVKAVFGQKVFEKLKAIS